MSHTTEVTATFCIFFTILAKIWLLWQSPLDSWNQKCLVVFGRPRNLCHRTKNVNNSRNYANAKVRDQFTITGIGNFQYFCNKCVKLLKQFYLNPKRTYLARKYLLSAISDVITTYTATCASEQEHINILR